MSLSELAKQVPGLSVAEVAAALLVAFCDKERKQEGIMLTREERLKKINEQLDALRAELALIALGEPAMSEGKTMTDQEPTDLELNNSAAERIMGWKRIKDASGSINWCSWVVNYWRTECGLHDWRPTTDLNDAFTLLGKLGIAYVVSDAEVTILPRKPENEFAGTRECPMGPGTAAIARAITVACLRYAGVEVETRREG